MVMYGDAEEHCMALSNMKIEIYTNSIWLGQKHTNNTAKFVAFIAGMSAAKAMGIETVHVEGDSKMIVDLLNGKTTPRKSHIGESYRKAKELADSFTEFWNSIHWQGKKCVCRRAGE